MPVAPRSEQDLHCTACTQALPRATLGHRAGSRQRERMGGPLCHKRSKGAPPSGQHHKCLLYCWHRTVRGSGKWGDATAATPPTLHLRRSARRSAGLLRERRAHAMGEHRMLDLLGWLRVAHVQELPLRAEGGSRPDPSARAPLVGGVYTRRRRTNTTLSVSSARRSTSWTACRTRTSSTRRRSLRRITLSSRDCRRRRRRRRRRRQRRRR